MANVKIDMNDFEFQQDLFKLEKIEQTALLKTLKRISQLKWEQLYADKGLHWEAISSKGEEGEKRTYSLRFSRKYRAMAYREGDFLCLLSLHPDHDSAYH